jgi:hypothetical protein
VKDSNKSEFDSGGTHPNKNKPNSKFAQHTYNTIEKAMNILHRRRQLQINDTYTDIHNPIFDLITKHILHNNESLPNSPSLPPPKESLPHSPTIITLLTLPK